MTLAKTGKDLSAYNLVEVNYQSNVTPWLMLQPVAQWFVRPQGAATRPTFFVIGLCTKVTF